MQGRELELRFEGMYPLDPALKEVEWGPWDYVSKESFVMIGSGHRGVDLSSPWTVLLPMVVYSFRMRIDVDRCISSRRHRRQDMLPFQSRIEAL